MKNKCKYCHKPIVYNEKFGKWMYRRMRKLKHICSNRENYPGRGNPYYHEPDLSKEHLFDSLYKKMMK